MVDSTLKKVLIIMAGATGAGLLLLALSKAKAEVPPNGNGSSLQNLMKIKLFTDMSGRYEINYFDHLQNRILTQVMIFPAIRPTLNGWISEGRINTIQLDAGELMLDKIESGGF